MNSTRRYKCLNCGSALKDTKYFCCWLCAKEFSESEDKALYEQQKKEIDYIHSHIFGADDE